VLASDFSLVDVNALSSLVLYIVFQCFDAVGCAAGRASGAGAHLHVAQLMPPPLTVNPD